jgi:putative nucleotidyltransferase with HDIG domain
MQKNGALDRYEKYTQYIYPAYFHNPKGIHGINHTKRVLFLVELLAALENLVEPERDVLSMAAVYHDIGRTSDGADRAHGYVSLSKVERMGLERLEDLEEDTAMKYLIETHCINDKDALALVVGYGLKKPGRAKSLLMLFKDADGLDRVRINDLNPGMLRLPVSRELVQIAEELLLVPDINTLFSAT